MTSRPVGPRMRRRFSEPRGFMSHNSDVRPLLTELTDAVQELAQIIGEVVPPGRSQELALTSLEEVHLRSWRAFDHPEEQRTIGDNDD